MPASVLHTYAERKGWKWATDEINETVRLLSRRFTDPADATSEAFEALRMRSGAG